MSEFTENVVCYYCGWRRTVAEKTYEGAKIVAKAVLHAHELEPHETRVPSLASLDRKTADA